MGIAGGRDDTILTPWTGETTPRMVASLGHRVIMASLRHHYLDFSYAAHPLTTFWYDVKQRGDRDADPRRCSKLQKKVGVYIRGDVTDFLKAGRQVGVLPHPGLPCYHTNS